VATSNTATVQPVYGESQAPAAPRPVPVADLSADPVCTIRNLTKSFSGSTHILRGIDLNIGQGESVALIGSNGAGKSTLLRCLVRLIEPNGGSIHLLDRPVMELGSRQLRRLRSQVGFVFQRHNLVPRLTALTNVLHGAQATQSGPRVWYQSLASSETRQHAMHCLDRVGLSDIALRRADQLSGGQSQRVAIARTLMQKPKFVIADEPVASLDPVAGVEVMDLFVQLLREDGITLLFTSHHLGQAIEFSDRVIGLQAGQVTLNCQSAKAHVSELKHVYE